MPQDILSFAGMTTVVGMSVVFSALFMLSLYMIFFKKLLASFEEKKRQMAAPKKATATAAPSLEAAPASAAAEELDPEVAAVIALALHLDGAAEPEVPADVAAAIMTALHLHMQAARAANIAAAIEPAPPKPGAGGWRMAGLAESHGLRFQLQAQPRKASAA